MDNGHNEEGWKHECEICGAYLFSTRVICNYCTRELEKSTVFDELKKEKIIHKRDTEIDIGFSP